MADVVVGFYERGDQGVDGVGVLRWLDGPRWDLWLVGDEEVVHVASDEAGACGLLQDDLNDVLAVETTVVAQEGLLVGVVVLGLILEGPVEPAHREPRNFRRDGPAGECARGLVDVLLGVVGGAQREELE